MSQARRTLPQSKENLLKTYTKRLKDDVKSVLDNFTEIVKASKIETETQVSHLTQAAQDQYEIHVRAANIVRAGESLMKLVSDIKEFLVLNDFPSLSKSMNGQKEGLMSFQRQTDLQLLAAKDDLSSILYELEESYYSSKYR